MTICGTDCCKNCERLSECGGCKACGGHPFGGDCVAAEIIKNEGKDAYEQVKKDLMAKINSLGIDSLHVDTLYLLSGSFVNLEYPLSNGTTVKYLKDNDVYLGNQIERADSDRCYGVVANQEFILVCEYGCGGSDPQVVIYKRIK